MTIERIKEISTENNMPLNISMFGAVRERLIFGLCNSGVADEFILMSEGNTKAFLKSGCWDKLRNEPISYEITSEKMPDDEKIVHTINDLLPQCEIRTRNDSTERQYDINVLLGNYHVPIKILFRKINCVRRTEKLVIEGMFDNINCDVKVYSPDESLVENIIEIMDKLELITNLESYDNTYRLLQSESIEGRRIKIVLEEGFKNKELSEKEARVDTIAGYKNYPYMKKKWNRYLKAMGRKDPEWSTVVTTISSFMGPLVESIENDTVFFSDWMPELQRYLD